MTTALARILPLAAALLLAVACGSAEAGKSGPNGDGPGFGDEGGIPAELSGRRLERAGVSIELPNGWSDRVVAPGVLQAANFDFVPLGQELPPGEEDPIKAMTAEHALVTILPCDRVSMDERPRPAPQNLSLRDLAFLPPGDPRVPVGHAYAQGSFDVSGRCVRVEVDFGGTPAAPNLKKTVDAILASLSVARS